MEEKEEEEKWSTIFLNLNAELALALAEVRRQVEEKQKDLCRYTARCHGESSPHFLSHPKFDQFQILFIITSDYHDWMDYTVRNRVTF